MGREIPSDTHGICHQKRQTEMIEQKAHNHRHAADIKRDA
jgi:hypothetical protein